tara:strand:+ start:535 stop:747 length:213 start_codon:yes stop_codon:yes gene_type:complete
MENSTKACVAIKVIKENAQFSFTGDILTEEDFNNINWKTGEDVEGASIMTTTNPHSEITWSLFKAEIDKL